MAFEVYYRKSKSTFSIFITLLNIHNNLTFNIDLSKNNNVLWNTQILFTLFCLYTICYNFIYTFCSFIYILQILSMYLYFCYISLHSLYVLIVKDLLSQQSMQKFFEEKFIFKCNISDKVLLMLQSLKRCFRLDSENPRLHSCLIRFHKVCSKNKSSWDPAVIEVVERETKEFFGDKNAKVLNADFLKRHSKSLEAALEGASMMYFLDEKTQNAAINLVTCMDNKKYTDINLKVNISFSTNDTYGSDCQIHFVFWLGNSVQISVNIQFLVVKIKKV